MLAGTEGLPDEEVIRLHVELLGMSETQIRFILAIERGELPPTGDVILVDQKGKRIPYPAGDPPARTF